MIYDGPLCSADLETTGTNPHEDRIVTAFVGIVNADGTLGEHREWLVNPGVEIPAIPAKIHGVTTARARAEGADPKVSVLEIEEALASLQADGIPLVVMNAPFDLTMLDAEIARYYDWRPLTFTPRLVLDPLVLDRAVDRYRPGRRTLTALCSLYRIPYTKAHNAAADAIAAAALVRKLLPLVEEHAAKGGWDEPITLETLQLWQRSWRAQQTTSLLDYYRDREARQEAGNPYGDGLIGAGDSQYSDEDFPTTWPMHARADAPDIMGETGVIYVCAACGMPIETEPCAEHQPRAYREANA